MALNIIHVINLFIFIFFGFCNLTTCICVCVCLVQLLVSCLFVWYFVFALNYCFIFHSIQMNHNQFILFLHSRLKKNSTIDCSDLFDSAISVSLPRLPFAQFNAHYMERVCYTLTYPYLCVAYNQNAQHQSIQFRGNE